MMDASSRGSKSGKNVSGLRTILGTTVGALLAGLLMVSIAAAQQLPPPPATAAPATAAPKTTPKSAPKAKPTRPIAQKPQPPATSAPLSLNSAPPRPPADIGNAATSAPPPNAQSSPLPPNASQFDMRQRALVERVSAYLSNMRTLVGEFRQVAPDGTRTNGDFYLMKPGRVRFDYNAPSPIELIADGRSVAVRDRVLASQDLYPISQTPLRFLLADRIDLLRDTNLVAVYGDDVFVTVVIEERQIIQGKYRLMLMFGTKDYQLKQWTVTDPQGFDTTVAVFNLDPNTKPDPELFRIDYTRYVR
jgi:outer membrane lipoprotein-sorting protein